MVNGAYLCRGKVSQRRGRPDIPLDSTELPDPDTFTLGVTEPDATNTGAGILRPYPTTEIFGNVTLSGTQSLLDTIVHGRVICTGTNLIENCVVDGGTPGGGPIISTSQSTMTTIRFTTVFAATPSGYWDGIGNKHYFAFRCHVYGTTDLFGWHGSTANENVNNKIHGCYGHDMVKLADPSGVHADGTHNDWVQMQGGVGGEVIGNSMHATFDPVKSDSSFKLTAPGNNQSAVMINSNVGNTIGPKIDSNWIYGGDYAINANVPSGWATITNNRFDRTASQYGAGPGRKSIMLSAAMQPSNGLTVVSGNTYMDDGSAVVYHST